VPILEVDAHADGDASRPDAAGAGLALDLLVSQRPPTRRRAERTATAGILVTGLGVAGVVVGGIFGVLSISKNSEADKQCLPPDHTPLHGARGRRRELCDHRRQRRDGRVHRRRRCFVAGGLVLYFTAPNGNAVAVTPSASAHGAALGPHRALLSTTTAGVAPFTRLLSSPARRAPGDRRD